MENMMASVGSQCGTQGANTTWKNKFFKSPGRLSLTWKRMTQSALAGLNQLS
jgi:hypothetical protein